MSKEAVDYRELSDARRVEPMSVTYSEVCMNTEQIETKRQTVRNSVRVARGFSLLELSLVIVIMGLLMTVAAVSLLGAGNRAKAGTTKATMHTIKSAIAQYQLNENMYPVDLDALVKGKTPYLEDKKNADGWDQPLRYATPGRDGKPFSLISSGEDKQFGTEDDIDVWTIEKK